MRLCTLLAALCLLASCGTPAAPGAGSTPAQSATPIPTRPAPQLASPVATPNPATQPPATPVPATPTQASYAPILTLTYGSASRSTNAFSTSWEVEPGKRIYGDGWPMLRQMEAISIPVGATILFAASGMAQPTSGSVQIYRIEDDRQQSRPLPGYRPVRITGQGATLDVALDPGEYLLNVYLNWGANSASYGFRVILSPQ